MMIMYVGKYGVVTISNLKLHCWNYKKSCLLSKGRWK